MKNLCNCSYNEILSSPPLKVELTALALATKMKIAGSKKISDSATKPTRFEQTPTEPKKKIVKIFQNFSSPPEIRMNNTCNYNENCQQQ